MSTGLSVLAADLNGSSSEPPTQPSTGVWIGPGGKMQMPRSFSLTSIGDSTGLVSSTASAHTPPPSHPPPPPPPL
ncbi:hypothetical protein Hypma_005622 [Hypsizygus marmoreus]|uniref:Uncharacterized protein n=1 Tax=Hypsizygus marmoreus TaxID=39966 RepID=A0A369K3R2_HYPMA|nr:hypothetical protein Hypma_005622 [Hypsizygus marmoreus]